MNTTHAKNLNGGPERHFDHDEGKVYDDGGKRIGDLLDQREREFRMSALAAGKRVTADGRLVTMDASVADVSGGGTRATMLVEPESQDFVADIASAPLLVDRDRGTWFTQTVDDVTKLTIANGDAYGGKPPQINPGFAGSAFICTPYALACELPVGTDANADFDVMAAGARRIIEQMQLAREIRVSTLLQTSGSFASSGVVTLGATFKWDGGSAPYDALSDVMARADASWLPITDVIVPERLLQWVVNQTKFANALMAAERFPMPTIRAAKARTISGGNPLLVWASHVVCIRRASTREGLCTSRTLRWNGIGPDDRAQEGFYVREYALAGQGSRGMKGVVVMCADSEIMVSSRVGGLILNAWQ